MTSTAAVAGPRTPPWTCPFCPLLCDDLSTRPDAAEASAASFALAGGACARAEAALQQFGAEPSRAAPLIDGRACSLDEAVGAAAGVLRSSRQPLFGGLGTEVAGARALYRLACATGAISDAAEGRALMHSLRALQDRGSFTTTLAEVRARADVVLLLEPSHVEKTPRLFERLGVIVDVLPLHGDLFATLALLAAAVDSRALHDAPADIVALAAKLRAARYAVIVGATGSLPAHGELIVEAVGRIVGQLNLTTRAAALWLGGGNGASTVNHAFTWLSGLPLRSRAGPRGLEHEPVCFDADRLLAEGAVDCVLWTSSFDAQSTPPTTTLPLIVIGHPALASSCTRAGSVFIPVSTPGIGSAGHLFRTDGTLLLPLFAARPDTLPTLADVVSRIEQAIAP